MSGSAHVTHSVNNSSFGMHLTIIDSSFEGTTYVLDEK